MTAPAFDFPSGAFRRLDEDDDRVFYGVPRRVVHIDDGAIAALAWLYERLLPPRGAVLDLMASWRSHLPPSFAGSLVGLGMNAEEMADNPQLAIGIVHDLNRDPCLPFGDAQFDAAVCAVSVQYLTRPVAVFRDVRRTLRPGAPFVVSFSNRCFPTKAVALWRIAEEGQHLAIVTAYFAASAAADSGVATSTAGGDVPHGWGEIETWSQTLAEGDPLHAVWSTKLA